MLPPRPHPQAYDMSDHSSNTRWTLPVEESHALFDTWKPCARWCHSMKPQLHNSPKYSRCCKCLPRCCCGCIIVVAHPTQSGVTSIRRQGQPQPPAATLCLPGKYSYHLAVVVIKLVGVCWPLSYDAACAPCSKPTHQITHDILTKAQDLAVTQRPYSGCSPCWARKLLTPIANM